MAASVIEHRPTKTAMWSSHCSWTSELQKAREVPPVQTDVVIDSSKVAFSQICVEYDVFFNSWLRHGQHRYLSTMIWLWIPIFDLRKHNWVLLNRFRTEQGRFVHLMQRWGFVESSACDCGAKEQTMRHIVDDCPLRFFVDVLPGLCAISDETVEYLWFDLNL
jgi:hypothetical protein